MEARKNESGTRALCIDHRILGIFSVATAGVERRPWGTNPAPIRLNIRQENNMNPTRIALVSLVVATTAASTIAAVTKLSDKFTSSSLGC